MGHYKPEEVGYTDLSAMWDEDGPSLITTPTTRAAAANRRQDELDAHRAEVRELIVKQAGEIATEQAEVELGEQSA